MDPLHFDQISTPIQQWINRDPIMRAIFDRKIAWGDLEDVEKAAEAAEGEQA